MKKRRKRFAVILTRDITESAVLSILAHNADEAIDKAYDQEKDAALVWNANEGNDPDDAHAEIL